MFPFCFRSALHKRCCHLVLFLPLFRGDDCSEGTSCCLVDALDLLRDMIMANVKPNTVTIVSVLPACSKLAALPVLVYYQARAWYG